MTEPSPYPHPQSARGTLALRPLRGALGSDVRQPDLGHPPAVVSLAGFGTGAGAGIRNNGSDADQSQGLVVIRCGPNPASSGTIVLNFPVAPPASGYWLAAEWATLAGALVGNQLTITWTGTRPLLGNETLSLAYQWTVST